MKPFDRVNPEDLVSRFRGEADAQVSDVSKRVQSCQEILGNIRLDAEPSARQLAAMAEGLASDSPVPRFAAGTRESDRREEKEAENQLAKILPEFKRSFEDTGKVMLGILAPLKNLEQDVQRTREAARSAEEVRGALEISREGTVALAKTMGTSIDRLRELTRRQK